jgi:threonylcarbamoyladenosine tRNA methylthiotransferase MtaB
LTNWLSVFINILFVTEKLPTKNARQLVRRYPATKAPQSTGCLFTRCFMAQLKPKEISEIPGVDLVLGAAENI